MNDIKILDCTLRDGGRLFDLKFDDEEIRQISNRLSRAKVDIIEVGFLRDWRNVEWKGNSTFFTSTSQMITYISKERNDTIYVAFIDYGMFDFSRLEPNDGNSIDGIRFGFTKKDYRDSLDEIKEDMQIIKDCGYKLFVQGVNSLSYTDMELLELIELINEVHPYSFGIVDTYGAMYIDDIDRIYALIDNNMDDGICIDFHSHNNYQLSFSLAQEIIKLGKMSGRRIIIDCTLNGMGKSAGNLNTELIVNYLVRKLKADYELDDILDIIDDYIYQYRDKYSWGYSIPAMVAGIYKSHPNNIIYLQERFQLQSKDIRMIVSAIDDERRQRYDYDNIDRIYNEYMDVKIDDMQSIDKLKKKFPGKKILVIAPGNSVGECRNLIDEYIKKANPIIITVNFTTQYSNNPLTKETTYTFFASRRRYRSMKNNIRGQYSIITSNIHTKCKDGEIIVDYNSLIDRQYKYFENSTMMCLRLLKKLEVGDIALAGFDGFDKSKADNYAKKIFQNNRHIDEFDELNSEIADMLKELKETLSDKTRMHFITPSFYQYILEEK